MFTAPTSVDVANFNDEMTTFSIAYMQTQEDSVGAMALPSRPVEVQGGKYGIFSPEEKWRTDDVPQRAPGEAVKDGSFPLSRDNYFCNQYAFGKSVTVEEVQNQQSWVDIERAAANYVTEKFLIKREKIILDTIMPAASVTNPWDNAITFSGSLMWDAAGSKPIDDVFNAKVEIKKKTGMMANQMIIGFEAYMKLLNNASILMRLGLQAGATVSSPAQVNNASLAAIFGLDRVHVAGLVETTSKKAASTPTYDFLNDKGCLLYYAPTSGTIGLNETTAAAVFDWNLFDSSDFGSSDFRGIAVRSYPKPENLIVSKVEAFTAFDVKITGAGLGAYAAAVVSVIEHGR